MDGSKANVKPREVRRGSWCYCKGEVIRAEPEVEGQQR